MHDPYVCPNCRTRIKTHYLEQIAMMPPGELEKARASTARQLAVIENAHQTIIQNMGMARIALEVFDEEVAMRHRPVA